MPHQPAVPNTPGPRRAPRCSRPLKRLSPDNTLRARRRRLLRLIAHYARTSGLRGIRPSCQARRGRWLCRRLQPLPVSPRALACARLSPLMSPPWESARPLPAANPGTRRAGRSLERGLRAASSSPLHALPCPEADHVTRSRGTARTGAPVLAAALFPLLCLLELQRE